MRLLACVYVCCRAVPQLLDLTIDRDKPRFHVKIADFGLARMVGPTSSIAVSKVGPGGTFSILQTSSRVQNRKCLQPLMQLGVRPASLVLQGVPSM